MRILHVTKKYPNALGGDSVVVANLQNHQEAAGHEVSILTSNCEDIVEGPHIYKFGLRDTAASLDQITFKRLVSLISLFYKAFLVLRHEQPDVIHTHSIDMAFGVSFAARFYKIPLLHTFHIVTFYDKTQPLLRRKAEVALAKASRLGVVTAPNAQDVAALRRAGLAQTVVLPNGVDLDFWKPNDHVVKTTFFSFVSTGRLESQKGYQHLIKAVSLLQKETHFDFRVTVIGDGNLRGMLENTSCLYNLEYIITFVGKKSPHEVRSLLSQADAAIFASLYETTPLTLLEAWAMKLPVIATPVGILRGASPKTRTVYLAPSGDEHALMNSMKKCMADEALRREVAEAGHKEAKKYGWADITQTTETLYRSVL